MIQSSAFLCAVVMNLNDSVCLVSVVSLQLWEERCAEDVTVLRISLCGCQQRYIDEAQRTYTWTPVDGTDYR